MIKSITMAAAAIMVAASCSAQPKMVEVDYNAYPYPEFVHAEQDSGNVFEIGTGSGYSEGGRVIKYFKLMDRLFQAGDEIRITSTSCASACTLFLIGPRTCISEKTTLKFHVPVVNGFFRTQERSHIELLAAFYNEAGNGTMGDWFLTVEHRTGPMKFVKVSGKEAIRAFGLF